MIDFRYHLVSIIGIFLALALGLLLGASALQQPFVEQLKSQTDGLARDNQNLRNQVLGLRQMTGGNDAVVKALIPQIVAARLKDERVVFIDTPGASETMHNQVDDIVRKANATVSGRVTIQSKFFQSDQLGVVEELSNRVKPAGVSLPQGTPYAHAAAVLASALVTHEAAQAGQEDPSTGQVLPSFKDAGFLTFNGKPGGRATLAIVIAPSTPYKGKDADAADKALIALAGALDSTGRGAVVAGPIESANDGGLIAALRDDDLGDKVSTVDIADTPAGQVTTVLALAAETKDKSGMYGVGPGAVAAVPTPVPTTTRKR